MDRLLLVGTTLAAAWKISNAYTGKTDNPRQSGLLSDALTTDGTSDVMDKMRGCWERITTEELYNNRGFSAWFGQTGETRKANTYRHLINRNEANRTGVLSAASKKKILGQAEKAMQYSRQAEHLFCQIAKPGNKTELTKAKKHAEDLLYLYAQRDKLSSSAIGKSAQLASKDGASSGDIEQEIASLSQIEEKLTIINARIEKAEENFKQELNAHLNKKRRSYSKVGYRELLRHFGLFSEPVEQRASNYQIEDFIRYYAFKVRLMTDQNFKEQVHDDFRKYIFCTSVGHLDAGEKLAYQYGRWIADLIDESSLGDVDSQSGNLSQYFMQTVYNLLNTGEPNFSLASLCVGDANQNSRLGTDSFDNIDCPNSYYLTDKGSKIVIDIVRYYEQLADIKSSDRTKSLLPTLDNSRKKTLLWNLVGGTHRDMNNKTKKGIFFRVDEQLKDFTSKTESAMHSKLDGFENKGDIFETSHQDFFVNSLPPNPYLANARQPNVFGYQYSPNQNAHSPRLNWLQSIADRCRLNDLGIDSRENTTKKEQLQRLKRNYEHIIGPLQQAEKQFYVEYFEGLLGDKLAAFQGIVVNANDELDSVLTSGWEQITDEPVNDCIDSARDHKKTVKQQKFNMVFGHKYDKYLTNYAETTDNLRKALNESALAKDMTAIIGSLSNLKDVIKFYNDIVEKEHQGIQIGLLATPAKLITLTKLAVVNTKDQVSNLYARFKQLDDIYGKNDISLHHKTLKESEQEIFEYSLLKTLFTFIEDQSKADSANPSLEAKVLIKDAVESCIKKLDSIQYINLATNNINALNSRRLLIQLIKQKDILVEFAQVFSNASINPTALQEFTNSFTLAIADLGHRCNKLVEENDVTKVEDFNNECLRMHAWLLEVFINEKQTGISTEYRYGSSHGKEIKVTLPIAIAQSCQENYRDLQRADFTSENWRNCSQVHRTLLKNMLDSGSSTVSKMTLYLGQLFSDGFTYNPQTNDIPLFQKLLARYETAVTDSLTALNTMGYLHQELLGYYGNLINGVEQLFAMNTAVALRSKLLIGFLNEHMAAGLNENSASKLTKEEQQLYLTFLYKSNLYQCARSDKNPNPTMKLNEDGSPDINYFESHSPRMFANPAQVIGQLVGYMNNAEIGNHNDQVRDVPLTNYAVSTATMIEEVKEKSANLYKKLSENKGELERFTKDIEEVTTRVKGNDTLTIKDDTIDSCTELLRYFGEEREGIEIIDGQRVIITKLNTLHLADVYDELFVNLYSRLTNSKDQLELEKIKTEFVHAYDAIRKVALVDDVALFKNISKKEMSTLKGNEGLVQKIKEAIKGITNNQQLSTIERPLNFETLNTVYEMCSAGQTTSEERELIQKYLNVFQYKKIEQSLAKFYIAASNNLPKLAASLNSLYNSAEALNPAKTMSLESKSEKYAMEGFIVDSNNYLNNITQSLIEWKSLLLEKSDYAWLVNSRRESLEQEHKSYFDWFTATFLKLDIVNLGASGSLRDELQFMIILDYLKVYRNLEEITLEEIELIKRFYHSPDKITQKELSNIKDALKKIATFLSGHKQDLNFIDNVFSNLEQCWQKFVGFFFSNQPDIDVGTIKFDLQKLYNQFYFDVIKKGTETVRSISKQQTQLNEIKQTFSQLNESIISKELLDQYVEVSTAAGMYEFFLTSAFSEQLMSSVDLDNILSLLVEAVKAKFPADKDIQLVDVTVIKKIVSNQQQYKERDNKGEYFVEQAKDLSGFSLMKSAIFM